MSDPTPCRTCGAAVTEHLVQAPDMSLAEQQPETMTKRICTNPQCATKRPPDQRAITDYV